MIQVKANSYQFFNILTHNRDDHVKNFAFVLSSDGDWRLAPAYDLTFAHGPGGEHTMTVAGEGRSPALEHVLRIADGAGIENESARRIIDEVTQAVNAWSRHADAAELDSGRARKIRAAFLSLG